MQASWNTCPHLSARCGRKNQSSGVKLTKQMAHRHSSAKIFVSFDCDSSRVAESTARQRAEGTSPIAVPAGSVTSPSESDGGGGSGSGGGADDGAGAVGGAGGGCGDGCGGGAGNGAGEDA